jgi:hypothetical protein
MVAPSGGSRQSGEERERRQARDATAQEAAAAERQGRAHRHVDRLEL